MPETSELIRNNGATATPVSSGLVTRVGSRPRVHMGKVPTAKNGEFHVHPTPGVYRVEAAISTSPVRPRLLRFAPDSLGSEGGAEAVSSSHLG